MNNVSENNTLHDSRGGTPLPVRLMKQHKIRYTQIAAATGVDRQTVKRVLDLNLCRGCGFESVMKVRGQLERLLQAVRWEGDASTLWNEYDEQLKNVA